MKSMKSIAIAVFVVIYANSCYAERRSCSIPTLPNEEQRVQRARSRTRMNPEESAVEETETPQDPCSTNSPDQNCRNECERKLGKSASKRSACKRRSSGSNTRNECVCETECEMAQVIGDPYYLTFDGNWFEFHGRCEHLLVKPRNTLQSIPDFEIYLTNVKHWLGMPAVSDADKVRLLMPSLGFEAVLANSAVQVNGKDISVPYYHFDPNGTSEHYVQIEQSHITTTPGWFPGWNNMMFPGMPPPPGNWRSNPGFPGWPAPPNMPSPPRFPGWPAPSPSRSGPGSFPGWPPGLNPGMMPPGPWSPGMGWSLKTSFGLKIEKRGINVYVYIPRHPELLGNTVGILGNFDGNPKNDPVDMNGKQRDLNDPLEGLNFGLTFCKNPAEAESARQEMVRYVRGRKRTLLTCVGDRNNTAFFEKCNNLRTSANAPNCKNIARLVEACRRDVCFSPTPETKLMAICNAVDALNQDCELTLTCN